MPGQTPPESPSVKRNKKAIDGADKEARSAKKTVSTPKKAAGTDATSPNRTRENRKHASSSIEPPPPAIRLRAYSKAAFIFHRSGADKHQRFDGKYPGKTM